MIDVEARWRLDRGSLPPARAFNCYSLGVPCFRVNRAAASRRSPTLARQRSVREFSFPPIASVTVFDGGARGGSGNDLAKFDRRSLTGRAVTLDAFNISEYAPSLSRRGSASGKLIYVICGLAPPLGPLHQINPLRSIF